jgi:hypothetical protein
MSFNDLFQNIKYDILNLDTLPLVFKKTKKTKSFKQIVTYIRKTFKELIKEELKMSNSDLYTSYRYEDKIEILGKNIKYILDSVGMP